jgi:P-type Cu2+ transporter
MRNRRLTSPSESTFNATLVSSAENEAETFRAQFEKPAVGKSQQGSGVGRQRRGCFHCGESVPPQFALANRSSSNENDPIFCCGGCATAYQLIHDNGLESYYLLLDERGAVRVDSPERTDRFSHFDTTEFQKLFVKELPDSRSQISLCVPQIHCAACVWLLEKLPNILAGVTSARVHMAQRTLTIVWRNEQVSLSRIARMVDSLGYTPHPMSRSNLRSTQNDLSLRDQRQRLVQIGIAAAAAGNNMLIGAALYLGWFSGMDPAMTALFRWLSFLLGWLSLAGPGLVFFRGAYAALRTRTPHMDVPIAIGLIVGGVSGSVNTFRGHGEVYFDSLSALVLLLLVGRWFQAHQQRRAIESVDLLDQLTPRKARRLISHGLGHSDPLRSLPADTVAPSELSGSHQSIASQNVSSCETIPVELLRRDDIVEVLAGEMIPADGIVLTGKSLIDESLLTGESRAVDVSVGAEVSGGTLNLNERLTISVTAVGTESRVGRLAELIESSQSARPRIIEWADQIGAHFVIWVLALAAGTWAVWNLYDAGRSIEVTIALLIVACPCALGLATPLALAVALGKAARNRILIKGADVFQRLTQPGTIWLDKTGTLTQGKLRCLEWFGERSVQPLVAEIESHSSHPVAQALSNCNVRQQQNDAGVNASGEANREGYQLLEDFGKGCESPKHPKEIIQSNRGVQATVGEERFLIGSVGFMREQGIEMNGVVQDWLRQVSQGGGSPVVIARNHQAIAVASIGDAVRSDSRTAVAELKRLGWKVGMLSGDCDSVAQRVAREVGIDREMVHSELTPRQKVAFVESARSGAEGAAPACVVMVGDGVNDSAALAAADVGIAMRDGAEVSLQAAPIYLDRAGIFDVVKVIHGANQTMHTIRRSLVVSLAYNIIAVLMAMFGLINPLVAALLMPLSSTTVIGLAFVNSAFGGSRTHAVEGDKILFDADHRGQPFRSNAPLLDPF